MKKILDAATASIRWYERMDELICLSPMDFAYSYMTRTGPRRSRGSGAPRSETGGGVGARPPRNLRRFVLTLQWFARNVYSIH
jgi:hypothetical protein